MATNGLRILFGGGAFFASDVEDANRWLSALEEAGINTIDSAESYGKSEQALGEAGAASRFTIDTKFTAGFGSTPATKDNVIAAGTESLKKLKTKGVDIYYIHAPDRKTPIKETLAGLDVLHKQGAFKRLGISNFDKKDIEDIIQVAQENNYVAPSVYQGNYSAIARRTETEIFPILRKHNISFYAYSPIAGGFLSKSKSSLQEKGGRFNDAHPFAHVYNGMYNKSSFMTVLDKWEEIADDEKVTRAELAYRWIVYHSKLESDKGDGVIIGARNVEQLKETVEAVKAGPLKKSSVQKIEEIWDLVKDESKLDNFEWAASK